MSNFIKVCKKQVIKDYHSRNINPKNVFVVWSCKTLQNAKALLGTDVDGSYYEFTYNGDKHETYMDKYKHVSNNY